MLSSDTFTGQLVFLDGVTEADIPTVARWARDIEYSRYLRMGVPELAIEKDIRQWMLEEDPGSRYMRPFAIRTLDTHELVGTCAPKDLNWQAHHCLLWIGIGDPIHRGKGYGTDATRILLRFIFRELNMQRVALEVAAFNAPARRAYEKVGFQLEGTLRRFMFRDGRYWDLYIMAILREEWEALQADDTE